MIVKYNIFEYKFAKFTNIAMYMGYTYVLYHGIYEIQVSKQSFTMKWLNLMLIGLKSK